MTPLLYNIGFLLIYFPHILLWANEKLIRRYPKYFLINEYFFLASLGGIFTFLMIYLNPVSSQIYILYYLIFILFYALTNYLGFDSFETLSLSIYVCFAISALWEWPIQLVIPQNPDALLLSMFRWLGLLFFISWAVKKGWKPSILFSAITFFIFLIGILLSGLIIIYGAKEIFIYLHLYRFPWVLLFMMILSKIYISRSNIKTV